MHNPKLNQDVNSVPKVSPPMPDSPLHRFDRKRYALSALILFLTALVAYPLSLRLISQIYYQRAMKFMHQRYYGLAAQSLQKSAIYQPEDYKIHRHWANAVYKLGELDPTAEGAYDLADKAKARFQEAFRLNPLDAQSAYGLAWQEDRLEFLYAKLDPDDIANPHNARPYYEQAIRLRPNGIRYHYALAQYLYQHEKIDDLHFVVRRLTGIFPPAYQYLKKKDILLPAIKAACRQGLQAAIKNSILPAAAHMALVDMATEEKEWASAIYHFQQAYQLEPKKKTDQAYFKLGFLFLKNGDVPTARDRFIKSLSLSRNQEKSVEHLYHVFKEEDLLNEFIDFYHRVQQQFSLLPQSGILVARSFIDLKQYEQARRVLEELNANDPAAESYYWLALVARKEEDWDRMERAIQKATVLEPENHHYRRIFFKLLKRRQKFQNAEWQLDRLIDNSEIASASLYDEKAWLRWRQKDYAAAAEAWQSAIRLKSDDAVFYARAAEAYVMIGDWSKAVEYYQKAAGLDPHNQRYKERYQQLMGSDSES